MRASMRMFERFDVITFSFDEKANTNTAIITRIAKTFRRRLDDDKDTA